MHVIGKLRWVSALSVIVFFIPGFTFANVIGSDAQNFAPTPDGIDFVTVHASETLEPGIINFGFYINYAQNTFPTFEGDGGAPSQSLLDKNDSFTSADLNVAIGLMDNFQVGFSMPYVINQTIDDSDNIGVFEGSGFAEFRPSMKYKFYSSDTWGFATSVSANFNRIENNPYLGEDAGPTMNLEFIADRRLGLWNVAFNVGHRWRDSGDAVTNSGIDPLPNQWIYSTALSYLFEDLDTKIIGEIYGSTPTEGTPNLSTRQSSSIEALLGLKYDVTSNLAAQFGAGTELSDGTSTPDYRIYGGINYAFGPVFKRSSFTEVDTGEEITLSDLGLRFKFGTAELVEDSLDDLEMVVARIKRAKKFRKLIVEGHTDSVGRRGYNQGLSLRRAQTIQQAIEKGVPLPSKKIQGIGRGEDHPIADNGNYQGRARNRRVEIRIVK
ncbi:MAG: hypothetical protein CL677_03470 [Bdellovibrionaceae bacterium]|nr:hypothetical protein [Pseudobdellovibrionaceae bacterium]|tara:strand:- start:114133 stop:115446 length:1314 start_codon:yes stop_codon:yes gene_type:complete